MAARIVGSIDDLIATLQQEAGHSVKTVNDAMQMAAEILQKEAKERVPVEYGNVENAIKIENLGRRRGWAVGVDESMPDNTGKYTVGDYATWLHEGRYNLGEKSIQKEAITGKPVGPKYIERPFQEMLDNGLVEHLQNVLNAELMSRK